MLVYVADKKQFLNDCDFEDIEEVIQTKFKEITGNSLQTLPGAASSTWSLLSLAWFASYALAAT